MPTNWTAALAALIAGLRCPYCHSSNLAGCTPTIELIDGHPWCSVCARSWIIPQGA